MIKIKRAYETPEKSDGYRILTDRLWPRGVSKQRAKLKMWMKDIAPSTGLRKWFSHEPAKWSGFRKKYTAELMKNKPLLKQIKQLEKKNRIVTLIYSAKDTEHNDAVVQKEVLSKI